MTWSKAPEVHVLATAVIDATPTAKQAGHAGEVVPQIWTYEKQLTPAPTGQPYRAFVWMQGHFYSNFTEPADSADAAARHRLGCTSIGRHADDRTSRARRPRNDDRRASRCRQRTGRHLITIGESVNW